MPRGRFRVPVPKPPVRPPPPPPPPKLPAAFRSQLYEPRRVSYQAPEVSIPEPKPVPEAPDWFKGVEQFLRTATTGGRMTEGFKEWRRSRKYYGTWSGKQPDSLLERIMNTYIWGFKYPEPQIPEVYLQPIEPRRVSYQPVSEPGTLARRREDFGQQLQREMETSRLGTLGHDPFTGLPYVDEASRAEGEERARISEANRLASGAGGELVTYQPEVDQYGRPKKYVDPALMERVMGAEPADYRITFNPDIPRSGQEFIDYMMEEGVLPHFTTQGMSGVPRSGKWTDYLLSRLGLGGYGVNPYARPYPAQQQPAAGGYGGYGGSGGYSGGGGGYTKEPLKQYGSVRTSGQRNVPQWLMDMVVWNI